MVKFLKESEYSIKDKELKIKGKCKQFTTSQQSHMLELLSSQHFSDRIELGKYALENCVTKLSVDGVDVDFEKFANYADLSDNNSLKTYIAVGELCSVANRISEEEEKK